MWPDVRVACVWIAQWPLRVEILRHPAWDGRPLVLPPDPVRTVSVLEAVLVDLQRVSPLVEPGEGDDGYYFLDLRGLQGMYGELAALEEAIRAAVPPLLRPRLGFANGKFAAAVAARLAEPGLSKSRVVPASETRAFLAPLSVRHLLMLEPDARQRMELLGVRTIGDLAALPFNAVQAQFGPPGAHAWRLAHGKDTDPVVARPVNASVQDGLRFDDPLGSIEAVMAAIDQLLAHTFSQPALLGRSVRQVRLRALLSDGTSWERLYTFKETLSTRDAARRALKSKLDLPNGLPPAPIEELALELLGLGGEAAANPGCSWRERASWPRSPKPRGSCVRATAACRCTTPSRACTTPSSWPMERFSRSTTTWWATPGSNSAPERYDCDL